jgi:uncharacterized SAM-binding protein YcdF (DUF218 family)
LHGLIVQCLTEETSDADTMFIYLKTLVRNLILPPGGLLILALIGLLLSARRPRLGGTLVVIGVVSLFLCSLPIVGESLQHLAERYPPLDPARPVNAQAVVILGGGAVRIAPEYGGPAAAFETLERLNYGAFVARRRSLPVLVSGSALEARAMQATLARDFGITARWVENRSGDTFENANFSARLLRPDHVSRIILVTSSTHEWRAVHEFVSAGFQVTPAPVGTLQPDERVLSRFVPNIEGLTQSYLGTYELIGDWARQLFAALHLRRQQPQN